MNMYNKDHEYNQEIPDDDSFFANDYNKGMMSKTGKTATFVSKYD